MDRQQAFTFYFLQADRLQAEPNRMASLLLLFHDPVEDDAQQVVPVHQLLFDAIDNIADFTASTAQLSRLPFDPAWTNLCDAIESSSYLSLADFGVLASRSGFHEGLLQGGNLRALYHAVSYQSLRQVLTSMPGLRVILDLRSSLGDHLATSSIQKVLRTLAQIMQAAVETPGVLYQIINLLAQTPLHEQPGILYQCLNGLDAANVPILPNLCNVLLQNVDSMLTLMHPLCYMKDFESRQLARLLQMPHDLIEWFWNHFIETPIVNDDFLAATAATVPELPAPVDFLAPGTQDAVAPPQTPLNPENPHMALVILTQPPEVTIKKRNLSPVPAVMFVNNGPPLLTNTWIQVTLVKFGSQEQVNHLEGDTVYPIHSGGNVEFQRLKITQTCLQDLCSDFYLKFQLLEGDGLTRRPVPGVYTFSNPVKVYAHTRQLKVPDEVIIPELEILLPEASHIQSVGEMVTILGHNIIPSDDLVVVFGPMEIVPAVMERGWVQFSVPAYAQGSPAEVLVTIKYRNTETYASNQLQFRYFKQ